MTNQIIHHQDTSITTHAPTLQTAFDVVLYSLSDTSKRQYRHTFKRWAEYALAIGYRPIDLSPQHIIGFLESEPLAHSTKSARLSHLRKLLETMHAQEPDNIQIESWYKQVKLLKVKRDENSDSTEREKHALKPRQIHDVFKVWETGSKRDTRNWASLAILFYAGLRRAEAAVQALRRARPRRTAPV